MVLLARALSRLIQDGELSVIGPDGGVRRFTGRPLPAIPPVTIRVHDQATAWRIGLNPGLAAGEAYMDGRLTVEAGTLRDFLALASVNLRRVDTPRVPVWRLYRRWQQFNPPHRSRRNATRHYDLSERLYALFLDGDLHYSCAYFPHPVASLEEAQAAKARHLAAKLLLRPGARVLDIGCGWGGLALALARLAEVEVLGITLSREQLAVARRRADLAGLAHRVRFELVDYRHVSGAFDRIVSVGMFEHVGVGHYRDFFASVRRLLAPDGVAVVHAIGRGDGPGTTNPWIRKYIFPGGYSPALSEVLPAIERSGLALTDLEILRGHYADTLAEWQRRFQAHRAEIATFADERFCRMWEFYLAGAEMSFRYQGHMVWQAQLARDPLAVPLMRDYIAAAERAWVAESRRAAE